MINFNVDELKEYIDKKYVSKRKHPELDLYVYNYTTLCEVENGYDNITEQTRGLILDNDCDIVARPFRKFYNIEQIDQSKIPNLPFKVYEKMDGSLLIATNYKGQNIFSTRGSFESEQAIEAQKIYSEIYNDYELNSNYTYLFEIIYPENQIVVNYGSERTLTLLAVIETKTGIELDVNLYKDTFNVVKCYDGVDDYTKIRDIINGDNREGFVIKFSNGYRIKLKYEEYFRLHKIMYQLTDKAIWEGLKDGKSTYELLENVSDEFYETVKKCELSLKSKFNDIHFITNKYFQQNKHKDRKQFALDSFKDNGKEISHIIFSYFNNTWKDVIWRSLEPKPAKFLKMEI